MFKSIKVGLKIKPGNPASLTNCAIYRAVKLVCSAGLSTMVLPVAKAGPNFHAIIRIGKFHGIICPQTPTGS